MENLTDYSSYVYAAYLVTIIATGGLSALFLKKYFSIKSKSHKFANEKQK